MKINSDSLVSIREGRSMSRKAVANKVGLTEGELWEIEDGAMNVIPDNLAIKLASILEVPIHYIMHESSKKSADIYNIGDYL